MMLLGPGRALADWHACGSQAAQPEPESPHGSEITEAAFVARESEGAASIVALYASLLTGLLVRPGLGILLQWWPALSSLPAFAGLGSALQDCSPIVIALTWLL